MDDVIEVGHFFIASLSASVEFGALEGKELVRVQTVIAVLCSMRYFGHLLVRFTSYEFISISSLV